jgi:hypothetical protein
MRKYKMGDKKANKSRAIEIGGLLYLIAVKTTTTAAPVDL